MLVRLRDSVRNEDAHLEIATIEGALGIDDEKTDVPFEDAALVELLKPVSICIR
jgi:hypothetical protein